jgi:uncharacterized membrane protein
MKYDDGQIKLKLALRGLKIFGLGLIITFITWIYPHEGYIIFGVLHCIGLSIILSYPFLKITYGNIFIGIIFIFIGIILKILVFDFSWLFWLGFRPSSFYTIDFFPILPWFGVVLVGIFIGNRFYLDYKRTFNLIDISNYKIIQFFCVLGRNSLTIYFIHQPLIIIFIYIFL